MTAISPLQLIHKKGLFGDHHRLNEKDLLIRYAIYLGVQEANYYINQIIFSPEL